MKPKLHTKHWFINRIGKRIFRDYIDCCKGCDEITKNGLIIHDKQHAEYLYTVQNDFIVGDDFSKGTFLNYRDKK